MLSHKRGRSFETLGEAMRHVRPSVPRELMRELDVLNKAASSCRHKPMVDTDLLDKLQGVQLDDKGIQPLEVA